MGENTYIVLTEKRLTTDIHCLPTRSEIVHSDSYQHFIKKLIVRCIRITKGSGLYPAIVVYILDR